MNKNMMFEDFRTKLRYEVNLANNIGKREEQQDTIYLAVDDREVLAVLCDGMGALKNGRLAGITAVRSFIENCDESMNSCETWMMDTLAITDEIVSQMNAGKSVPEAGTTLVAIYILDHYLQWVSAGDSRLYIFRDNELQQITNDHNYYFELKRKLDSGEISEEDYQAQQEYGEQLISFVGMGGLQLVDRSKSPFRLFREDVIFICSDGVYRAFEKQELQDLFNAGNTVEEIGTEIVRWIENRNYRFQDNYSFALIKLVE